MKYYLLISFIVYLFLGIVWSTNSAIDTLIKVTCFIMAIGGLAYALEVSGYLIKVH